jgi:hypothetical protein
VTARHAGEYTCTASNVAGGTSYSASLAVNGIEASPRPVYLRSSPHLTLHFVHAPSEFIIPT